MKRTHKVIFSILSSLFSTHGEALDPLYGVISTGSGQQFGSINSSTGAFSYIANMPSGLGWPLGDQASQPDPVNGVIFTSQGASQGSILSIRKSDGAATFFTPANFSSIVGYDNKKNELIYYSWNGSSNGLGAYDTSSSVSRMISSGWLPSETTWQAGGIGAVNSYAREAYRYSSSSNTLHVFNVDTGAIKKSLTVSGVMQIVLDEPNQKLFGIRNTGSGIQLVEISMVDGSLRQVSGSLGGASANYVQTISPSDGTYYFQGGASSSVITAVSTTTGSVIGSFSAPLRLFPLPAIVIGGSDNSEYGNNIKDKDTKVVKVGTGNVKIMGDNKHEGGTEILAGTVQIASSANIGAGTVILNGGALAVSGDISASNAVSVGPNNGTLDTNGRNVQLSGNISGTGKLVKVGAGLLKVDATISASGVSVRTGEVSLNGSVLTTVDVEGGILKGVGTISAINAKSGVVAPGNSIGTMTVSGDYIQSSSSKLEIEFDAAGNFDKFNVNGAATLAGGVTYKPEPGAYSKGTKYKYLVASGGVSGKFSSETTDSSTRLSGLIVKTNYFSNSVELELEQGSFAAVAISGSGVQMGGYLDSIRSSATGDLAAVLNTIAVLPTGQLEVALQRLKSPAPVSVTNSGARMSAAVNSVVRTRPTISSSSRNPFTYSSNRQIISEPLRNSSHLIGQSSFIQAGRQLSMNNSASNKRPDVKDLWVRGVYSEGYHEADVSTGGVGYAGGGVIVGLDSEGTNGNVLGVFVGISDTRTSQDDAAGKTDSMAVRVGAHWRSNSGGFLWDVLGSIGIGSNDAERQINIPGVMRRATAKYGSYDISLEGGVAMNMATIDSFIVRPEVRVGIISSSTNGYQESGAGALNLSVKKSDQASMQTSIGVNFIGMSDAKEAWSYGGSIFFNQNRRLNGHSSTQGFVGASSFTVDSGRRDDNNVTLGFGVSHRATKRSSWSLEGQHLEGRKERGSQIMLEYRTLW